MSLLCYQRVECPLSSISFCKAVLIEERKGEDSRVEGARRAGSMPGGQVASGSQVLPSGPVPTRKTPSRPLGLQAWGAQHQSWSLSDSLLGGRCFQLPLCRQQLWSICSSQGEPVWVKTAPLNGSLCGNARSVCQGVPGECHKLKSTASSSPHPYLDLRAVTRGDDTWVPSSSDMPSALYF